MGIRKGQDYVLGVDFGTDSVRALVVDAADGTSLGTAVSAYKRWARGEFCDPKANRFRQHPLDYVEGLEDCVKRAIAAAGKDVASKDPGHRDRHDRIDSLPRRRDGRAPLAPERVRLRP